MTVLERLGVFCSLWESFEAFARVLMCFEKFLSVWESFRAVGRVPEHLGESHCFERFMDCLGEF